MMVEFVEVSQSDGSKPVGPVFLNPRHIVRIRRAPTTPETQIPVSMVTDINKVVTWVEGGPSTTRDTLAKGGR